MAALGLALTGFACSAPNPFYGGMQATEASADAIDGPGSEDGNTEMGDPGVDDGGAGGGREDANPIDVATADAREVATADARDAPTQPQSDGGQSDKTPAGPDAPMDSNPPDTARPAVDAALEAAAPAPTRIVLTGFQNTPEHGAAVPSTSYTDRCAGDEAIIGYRGGDNNYVTDLQATCGRLVVSTTRPMQIDTVSSELLPAHGGNTASPPWTAPCPANNVVVGVLGRGAVLIDQIQFQCAPLSVIKSGNTYKVSIGTVVTLAAHGGTGGSAFQEACPSGQIARGDNIGGDGWAETFGLICGAPTAVP